MRIRNKTMYGRISPKGELNIFTGELIDFCNLHKGKAVVIRVEVQPTEPSERQAAYYFGYLVPEIRNALLEGGERMTKEQTDVWLRRQCPICIEETPNGKGYKARAKDFCELDSAEVNEYFEWVFQFASENLNVILEDAN